MYVPSLSLNTSLSVIHDLLPGIPILMFSWGLVTMAHALIKNRGGYLTGVSSLRTQDLS